MVRIKGLDSIRFICAVFVVFWHLGFPIFNLSALFGVRVGEVLAHTLYWLFNGSAAVIVFFIISGFCIHLPYRNDRSLTLLPYYSKRIIRICLPAFVAIGIYKYAGSPLPYPQYGVFWSIVCELAYYVLYPVILLARRAFHWATLLGTAYVAALLLVLFNATLLKVDQTFFALGLATWIVGLPCWLLGCWLAENYTRFTLLNTKQIWLFRAVIMLTPLLWKINEFYLHIAFPSPITDIVTLNIFALLACVWLGSEIVYAQSRPPIGILEGAGQWSYSLYMLHPIVPKLLVLLGLSYLPQFKIRLAYLLLSFIFAYLFFLLIEKPAHQLALYVGRQFKKNNEPRKIAEVNEVSESI